MEKATAIVMGVLVTVILLVILFWAIGLPEVKQCQSYKTVESIDYKFNFWNTNPVYFLRFSDGSVVDTQYLAGRKVGDKVCAD